MRAKIKTKKPLWRETSEISPVKTQLPDINFKLWSSGRILMTMNGSLRKYLGEPVRVQMLLKPEEKQVAILVCSPKSDNAKKLVIRGARYAVSFSKEHEKKALESVGLTDDEIVLKFLPEHEDSVEGKRAVFQF